MGLNRVHTRKPTSKNPREIHLCEQAELACQALARHFNICYSCSHSSAKKWKCKTYKRIRNRVEQTFEELERFRRVMVKRGS